MSIIRSQKLMSLLITIRAAATAACPEMKEIHHLYYPNLDKNTLVFGHVAAPGPCALLSIVIFI